MLPGRCPSGAASITLASDGLAPVATSSKRPDKQKMKGFILGLVVAALAFGGYLFWNHVQESGSQQASVRPDAGVSKRKKRRRGRGAQRVARARPDSSGRGPAERPAAPDPVDEEPEPEPVRLSAADLRSVSQGDDLGRPDVVHLDMGNDKQLPELSQDDIDAQFRGREEAILSCISRARPDAEAYVPGLVNIKFRIQRQGTVRGVRVEAPSILHKGGLYACVKGVVGGLRFPPSGSSQIVTYPFRLS
jgi:hypothetical protein